MNLRGGSLDDVPEVSLLMLAEQVLKAERAVSRAEESPTALLRNCHILFAQSALDAVDVLKRSGKVDILVETQVNASILRLRQRLFGLESGSQYPLIYKLVLRVTPPA